VKEGEVTLKSGNGMRAFFHVRKAEARVVVLKVDHDVQSAVRSSVNVELQRMVSAGLDSGMMK
jgi:hypothetical protein